MGKGRILKSSESNYRKPSEKAAGFILSIFDWVRSVISSTTVVIPRGHVISHHGENLSPGNSLRFREILLVEDNAGIADDFIEAIRNHYVYGSVNILVAHAFDAAVNFFECENVDLVIMDADLDDEDGDGAVLVRKFLERRPNLPILANSSSRISNHKLTGYGAVEVIGKNSRKLREWLAMHDPAGRND